VLTEAFSAYGVRVVADVDWNSDSEVVIFQANGTLRNHAAYILGNLK
jgi:hypothetical protein